MEGDAQIEGREQLKSLTEHNAEARGFYTVVGINVPCGLGCPACGDELTEDTSVVLTSNPPQTRVQCDCGYFGYKVR